MQVYNYTAAAAVVAVQEVAAAVAVVVHDESIHWIRSCVLERAVLHTESLHSEVEHNYVAEAKSSGLMIRKAVVGVQKLVEAAVTVEVVRIARVPVEAL